MGLSSAPRRSQILRNSPTPTDLRGPTLCKPSVKTSTAHASNHSTFCNSHSTKQPRFQDIPMLHADRQPLARGWVPANLSINLIYVEAVLFKCYIWELSYRITMFKPWIKTVQIVPVRSHFYTTTWTRAELYRIDRADWPFQHGAV